MLDCFARTGVNTPETMFPMVLDGGPSPLNGCRGRHVNDLGAVLGPVYYKAVFRPGWPSSTD